MASYRLYNPVIFYHLILFFLFSISINYFIELKYVNLVCYVIFHITFVYLAFYYYNYSLKMTGDLIREYIYKIILDYIQYFG